MPDECRHGIDANKRNGSLEDTDGDGYTDIEEYLNGTDPRAPQPWVFPPAISPPDGSLVAGQATVTLVSATEGARIHYTLDGSDPQVNSPIYTQPFSVARTCVVRARAFQGGRASFPSIAALTCVTPRVPIEVRHAAPGLRFRYFTDSISGDRKSPDAFSVESTPASAGIATKRPFEQPRNNYESGHHRFVYEGYLRAPQSGLYTFYVTADLLARLYIGDGEEELVFSRREVGAQSGQIALAKGLHRFRLNYLCPDERSNGPLTVAWEVPGVPLGEIAASALFHEATSNERH